MIKAIREAFDDFVIAARIKPAITAGIPLLLMVFFNGVVKCKWMEAGIGLALSLVVISFAAYIVRELGKTYEEKFYKALGGMPTTIILRFSDDTIDDITKVIMPSHTGKAINACRVHIYKNKKKIVSLDPLMENYDEMVKYIIKHIDETK